MVRILVALVACLLVGGLLGTASVHAYDVVDLLHDSAPSSSPALSPSPLPTPTYEPGSGNTFAPEYHH